MKLDGRDMPALLQQLDDLARNRGYTKIFAKVGGSHAHEFLANGYIREAKVPGFKKGKEDIFFLSKFLDKKRAGLSDDKKLTLENNFRIALQKAEDYQAHTLPLEYSMRELTEHDARELADLYQVVFEVYPFPIFDPKYLVKTMREHIRYFGAFENGDLVAAASSEMDGEDLNSEMTDFATRPSHLGKNLSYFLLQEMEIHMKEAGLKTLYTIARAESVGMNTTFARMGYSFAGQLVNNTMISTQIESMNVWYKSI